LDGRRGDAGIRPAGSAERGGRPRLVGGRLMPTDIVVRDESVIANPIDVRVGIVPVRAMGGPRLHARTGTSESMLIQEIRGRRRLVEAPEAPAQAGSQAPLSPGGAR